MKISTMKYLLVGVNSKFIHTNLALYYLKSYVEKYCEKDLSSVVSIKEFTINQQMEEVLREIYIEKPTHIAFSCYIWNIECIKKLTKLVFLTMPDVDIWLGGPEVTFDAVEFLKENTHIKGIMKGEGEETFKELLEHYHKKLNDENLKNVKGIAYTLNENKEINDNEFREVLNLSDVPFPYDVLDEFKNRILYYETSRGCPFSCKYCLSSVDKKIRIRDIELVKKELKLFLDKKVKQVKFIDRTFNVRKDHAISIWKFLKENDNGITNFHFEIAADLLDDEMIDVIKGMRPGLIQLEIGVQTTNEETICEISRKTSISEIKEKVGKIKNFKNSHIHLDLIAGLPFENYESFKKSFDDVYNMKPDALQLGFLKVLKGSVMNKQAKDYGIFYSPNAPYEVLYTKWLSYGDIVKLKDIESIVDTYYNSNQFGNSLKALQNFYNSSFVMYEEIACYFRRNNYFVLTPNRETKYVRLLEFIYDRIDNKFNFESTYNSDLKSVFCEVLTLDYYIREKAKKKPEFSKNDFMWSKDRNQISYNFEYDLVPFIKDNKLIKKSSTYILDYLAKSDYNNNYEYEIKNNN